MASAWNGHGTNCIGTLSFPIGRCCSNSLVGLFKKRIVNSCMKKFK